MKDTSKNYDIAIIGGGPAGYNAAERAADNGLNTILFEKSFLGGVCLNEGCIPTKSLLYSAKMLDNMKVSSKYGINASGLDYDLGKIMSRKEDVVKRLRGGVDFKLKSGGITTIIGEATIAKQENGLLEITCGNETYKVKYLLLCCGSEAIVPPIEGLSKLKFWTSKEALEISALPKSLTIIGGGVIGMEFASFFNSMGVKVCLIEMASEILGVMDKDVSAMLRKTYAKKGIDFRMDAKVVKVDSKNVFIEKDGKSEKIPTEQILISVGRKARVKGLGLESLKIDLTTGGGVKVNEYMQTNHPQVYACGDITGYSQLAHTAMREGEVAINHILKIEDKMDYNVVPSVVYTNPELAGVGKSEAELIAEGKPYRALDLAMAYSGRFVSENEGETGMFKLLVDADERIVGCHMVGNPASEIIVIASIAMQNKYTLSEFQKLIFPHPTVSEIFHEAIFT